MEPQFGQANFLLARFPEAARERLLRAAEVMEPSLRDTLAGPGRATRTVYFPLSGQASLVAVDRAGGATEVALIGREGMIGATALYEPDGPPFELTWQLPGTVIAVGVDEFRATAAEYPGVGNAVGRFLVALISQTAQNSGCNRLHDLDQRTAKWLLLCRDRVDSLTFPLTQDFLAVMLGVSRPKLTLVERTLARAGVVERRRGTLTILDPESLQEQACECYEVIRSVLEQLTAPD